MGAAHGSWHSAGMGDVAPGDTWVDDPLRARLATMRYTKRREEARLGRWTAKTAIAGALDLEPTPDTLRRIVVRNAADGAPEAFVDDQPARLTLAMTDRADWAVAAVTDGSMRVGCDLEVVEPRSAAFIQDYFTPAERAVVAAGDPDVLANLVWSAKESALKVMRTGLRRDTRTVEVMLGDDSVDGWHQLTVHSVEGRRFPGWWVRYGDFLLTVTTSTLAPPPVSIRRPPPLASAVPGHTWMEEPISEG